MRFSLFPIILIVVFFQSGLVYGASVKQVAQPSIKELTQIAKLFEDVAHATANNRSIWGIDLYGPLLIVNPKTRRVYSNFNDVTNEGESQLLIKAIIDTTKVALKSHALYTGLLPDEVNIANTAISWRGREWAMVMQPLPKDETSRLSLVVHELFHRSQRKLGFEMANPSNQHLAKRDARILLRMELNALKHALKEKTLEKSKLALAHALSFRTLRYKLFPDSALTENALELNEGLAEYTGLMSNQSSINTRKSRMISNIDKFLISPSYVRSFAYVTLPSYGLFLSDGSSNWLDSIDNNTSLTETIIETLGISLPTDLVAAKETFKGNYDGLIIEEEEHLREQQTISLAKYHKQKYLEDPHLEVFLENMNISFDPNNIIPLIDIGSVYQQMRVTDNWGILTVTSGALLSKNWNRIWLSRPLTLTNNGAAGEGWDLTLKDGFFIKQENNNFYLARRNTK
jgi:hypothetical protein